MKNDQKIAISFAESSSSSFSKYSPETAQLSVGMKMLLRPFPDNSYLMRVQNFKKDTGYVVIPEEWSFTEYTLSANQLQEDWLKKQYKWKSATSE